MPVYSFVDESGGEVVIQCSWTALKEYYEMDPARQFEFLNENAMYGVKPKPDVKYKKTLSPPALIFKGGGWGCSAPTEK